jgi:basic membrane protein A
MSRLWRSAAFAVPVVLLAVAGLTLAGCGGGAPEEAAAPEAAATGGTPVKAAFVYVSPVGDAGWTLAHDNARRKIDELDYVETAYTEAVPEGADAERTISQYVRQGYNLIFTTSFGYMDPTITVAASSPDVVFMHCSGFKTADNVGTYFGRMYQPRYLSGMIAGKMTESNILGYVAAHPIPEVIRGLNAFALGARSVNPDVKVHVVWTQTWYDPAKEREAAESLLDIGADVIAQHQDTPAPQQAAEKRGRYSIGYNSDMSSFAPAAHLTAPVWNWEVIYRKVVDEVHDGTWTSYQYWGGLEDGVVGLAPYSDLVPEDVREMIEAKKAEIVAGGWDVFTGPINNAAGEEWVPAGETMSDGDMLGMTDLVEGVVGTIPES